MKILGTKPPDRIALLEVGIIIGLVAVNLAFSVNREYTPIDPPFDPGPNIETPYVMGPIIYDDPPIPHPKKQICKEPIEPIRPNAPIELVSDLFKIDEPVIALQPKVTPGVIPHLVIQPRIDTSTIIDAVVADAMPEFPGGEAALGRYIQRNYRIPDDVLYNADQLMMLVEFILDHKGKVVNVQVVDCSFPGFGAEQEALRVYRGMPDWEPATYRGKSVKIRVRQPLRINISN